MKKLLSVLFCLTFVLAMTACAPGGGGAPGARAGNQEASDFPRRAIEFIVPFGAGGSSDLAARTIADVMSGQLGVPVNVVNAPGGGTATGMMQAFGQPADGYTVFFLTPSVPIVEAQGLAPINFSENFVPIGTMQLDVVVLSVHKDNELFQDLDGMIEFAKANPGAVTIGGISPRGLDEFIAVGFAAEAGIEITFVPYESQAEQRAALLGREILVYSDKIASFTTVLGQEEIVPIVTLHHERLTMIEGLEDVPTSVEKGINFTQGSWRALSYRVGVPQEIVDFMEAQLYEVFLSDEYQDRATLDNTNIVYGYKNAADTAEFWAEELEGFRAVFAE